MARLNEAPAIEEGYVTAPGECAIPAVHQGWRANDHNGNSSDQPAHDLVFPFASSFTATPLTGLFSASQKARAESVAPPALIMMALTTLGPCFSVSRFDTPSSHHRCRSL